MQWESTSRRKKADTWNSLFLPALEGAILVAREHTYFILQIPNIEDVLLSPISWFSSVLAQLKFQHWLIVGLFYLNCTNPDWHCISNGQWRPADAFDTPAGFHIPCGGFYHVRTLSNKIARSCCQKTQWTQNKKKNPSDTLCNNQDAQNVDELCLLRLHRGTRDRGIWE